MMSGPERSRSAVWWAGLAGGCLALLCGWRIGTAAEGDANTELKALTERVSRAVEGLRGWRFRRPVAVAAYSREDLLRKLREEFDEELPPDLVRHREALLRMAGVIPRRTDLKQTWIEMLSVQIGGFYEPKDGTFYILEDLRRRYGPLPLRTVIAHELTHALDDQHFDLEELFETVRGDLDREFAVAALIEGSATALMSRYFVKEMEEAKLGWVGMMFGSVIMAIQDAEAMAQMSRMPRYFHTILAAYMGGQAFLLHAGTDDAGGPMDRSVGEAVLRAAADPPQSSEQILHPARYWDEAGRDDPVVVSDDDVSVLLRTEGWEAAHRETLGELLCAIVTMPQRRSVSILEAGMMQSWTNEAARGWGGDRFYIVRPADRDGKEAEKPAEELRGVWVTVWDSAEDREQFVAAYRPPRGGPPLAALRVGELGAVYLFGFERGEAAAIEELLRREPPGLSRGDRVWSFNGVVDGR